MNVPNSMNCYWFSSDVLLPVPVIVFSVEADEEEDEAGITTIWSQISQYLEIAEMLLTLFAFAFN